MIRPTLPAWPPRDWRALLALAASITGAASLTLSADWIVWILYHGSWPLWTARDRIAILGQALMLLLGGGLVVLVSLGLAINRREIKVGRDGFEISGGDVEPVPPAIGGAGASS